MDHKARIVLAVTALISHLPAVSAAQARSTQGAEPIFAEVWIGGPLDSIYNAEYQRVQVACSGAGDECYQAELDTTAVLLAPVYSSPTSGEPSGWIAARLRARGAWPYAGLLFVSAEGIEVPLVEDLGDWGYGSTLDLVEARGQWLQPWLLAPAGGHWIGPDGGPGLGLVEGPYGLDGRLWRIDPVPTTEPAATSLLQEGVYMVLEVRDGTIRLRPELPSDMDCGEPADSIGPDPTVQTYEISLSSLLDASGRPALRKAYEKGC